MTDSSSRWCVLMSCSASESWAVPQNCLAEIVTVHGVSEQPPEELSWRGVNVPVLDFGYDDESEWREQHGGSGLIAIFLGLAGEGCDYWGVAIRGGGLAVKRLADEDIADTPEAILQHATAAFTLQGVAYQVPDLSVLQKKIANSQEVA